MRGCAGRGDRRGARRRGRRREFAGRSAREWTESGNSRCGCAICCNLRAWRPCAPRDGHGALYGWVARHCRKESLRPQKPCAADESGAECVAAQRASELFYRSEISRRAGLLREDGREPGTGRGDTGCTAHGVDPDNHRQAKPSQGVYLMEAREGDGGAGGVRLFIECGGNRAFTGRRIPAAAERGGVRRADRMAGGKRNGR